MNGSDRICCELVNHQQLKLGQIKINRKQHFREKILSIEGDLQWGKSEVRNLADV
jgi:hypothetical protein